MSMRLPKATAVILTALPEETEEVMRHLSYIGEVHHPANMSYQVGIFEGQECSWAVVVRTNGKRNARTAVETERAIQFFAPDVIGFVGCAGAIKDCAFADVVAPIRVCDYEAGAQTKEGFEGADQGGPIRVQVVEQLRGLRSSWRLRAKLQDLELKDSHLLLQPLASGEKTQKSGESPGLDQVKVACREAVAVDTESLGFYLATEMNNHDCAFIARGIADQMIDKDGPQDKIQQPAATALAAAVAFEFLARRSPKVHIASSTANKASGTAKISQLISSKLKIPEPSAESEPGTSPLDFTIELGAFAEGGFFSEAIAQKASGRDPDALNIKTLCEVFTLLQKKGDLENAWRFFFEASNRSIEASLVLPVKAHIYWTALKLFSQRGDKLGARCVVKNYENVLQWILRTESKGKLASIYSRAGVAYAVLGDNDQSRSCFVEASRNAAKSGNMHQSVTVDILWAIANRFRGVYFDDRNALQTVIDGQDHYLANPVDPHLAQAYALKSTVQCLFAEAAMLLYDDSPDEGRRRLAAASVMRRRAFAHPYAEGFAELLALIPDDATRKLVRSAMDPTEDLDTVRELAPVLKKCSDLTQLFSFGNAEWSKLRTFLDSDAVVPIH